MRYLFQKLYSQRWVIKFDFSAYLQIIRNVNENGPNISHSVAFKEKYFIVVFPNYVNKMRHQQGVP